MLPAYRSFPTHSFKGRFGRLLVAALFAVFAGHSVMAQLPNITYTQKAAFQGGLQSINSMAADSAGNVFLTDINSSSLYKETLNPDGSYTQSIVSTGATQPLFVVLDSSDNLYVADGAHTVYKETLSGGSYTESTVANTFTQANSLSIDAGGNVYVLDAGTGAIYKETPLAGLYVRSTIVSGLNFSSGGGVAVDSSGNVYVAETANVRALKETLSGGTYTQSVIADSTTLEYRSIAVTPYGIAVDATGTVLLAGQPYFFKAVPNGATYTTSPLYFANGIPVGVSASLDSRGNLYIANGNIGYVTSVNELAEAGAKNFGSLNLGAPAAAQTTLFTFDVGGTLAANPYAVSTQGDLTLDFQAAATQPANVCATGRTYKTGDTCTVAATFTPTRPGVRYGAIALFAPSGTPIATSFLQGVGTSPQVSFSPGALKTNLASTLGTSLSVDASSDLVFDQLSAGVVLDSFTNAHPIDIISPTFTTGYTGPAPGGNPFGSGYVVDGAGDVIFAEGYTSALSTSPGATAFSAYDVNPTLAPAQTGTNPIDATNYGKAFLASVPFPSMSVTPPSNNRPAVDGAGNLYFADDNGNQILEEQYVRGAYNNLTVVATGLNNPGDVVVDAAGAVYAADTGNDRIVKETPNGDGTYTQSIVDSGFSAPPEGLAIDRIGNLYVSLFNNFQNNSVPFILKETIVNDSYTQSALTISGSEGLDVDPAGNVFAAYPASTSNTLLSGIAGLDVVTAPSFIFAQTAVGSTSTDSPRTVIVTNNGNAPLNFGMDPAITSGFTLSNSSTCSHSAALAPAASCTLLINFVPTQSGVTVGTLTLTDDHLDNPGSTQVINLNGLATGTGTIAATLSPATIDYGSVIVGSSGSQSLTLANTGTSSINITAPSLPNPLFTVGNTNCGTALAAGASCTYSVLFQPTAAGVQTTTFSVTDDAGTQTASLTGTGTAAQAVAPQAALTPATANFGNVTTGTPSVAQSFTLANGGNAALAITSISVEGADASIFAIASNTCGASLAAGSSCAVSVTFTPVAAGSAMATLSVADNAAGSPQASSLTGAGTVPQATADFALTATPASQSIASGSSAAYSVNVASLSGNFTQPVTLTASGLPAGATVSFSPASVTPGSTGAQSAMTIRTAAQQASSTGGPLWRPVATPAVALALLILPFRLRTRLFRGLTCVLVLLGIAGTLGGCGGGFALPGSTPKTYTIAVTGTAGSDTHSTTVTLTVQ